MYGHDPVPPDRQNRGPSAAREPADGVRSIREVLAEVLSQYRLDLPEAARQSPAVEAAARG